MTKEQRAAKVYEKTGSLATGNAWIQGLSGIFGLGVNLAVDVAAIPFYVDLWNDVREIYGKGNITAKAVTEYLKPNLGFLVQDLLWDKAVGSIPVIGIPFNVAFAKALTWRLGAWFGLLSALGEESNPSETVIRATMQLTRELFPSVGDVFSFKAPEKQKFVTFISSVDGLTQVEAEARANRALMALVGQDAGNT